MPRLNSTSAGRRVRDDCYLRHRIRAGRFPGGRSPVRFVGSVQAGLDTSHLGFDDALPGLVIRPGRVEGGSRVADIRLEKGQRTRCRCRRGSLIRLLTDGHHEHDGLPDPALWMRQPRGIEHRGPIQTHRGEVRLRTPDRFRTPPETPQSRARRVDQPRLGSRSRSESDA